MATLEEQRAADYRAQQIARTTAIAARRAALHGSASARAALEAAWAPVKHPDPGFDVPDVETLVPGPETN